LTFLSQLDTLYLKKSGEKASFSFLAGLSPTKSGFYSRSNKGANGAMVNNPPARLKPGKQSFFVAKYPFQEVDKWKRKPSLQLQ
jgi:hypothetical protein